MHKFDYSFLKESVFTGEVLNLAAGIYSLKATNKTQQLNHPKIFSELEKIALVQSVKNSNAIEGIITSDERIRLIVQENCAPLNHDEAEIVGYRDALNIIHTNYQNINFNERDILQLHKIMLSHAEYDFGGRYKDFDNAVIEIDALGNRKVRFSPTPANETKYAMEQLVLAYMDAANDDAINKLALIPCVILDFLCIHPFRDGNGRLSRLLSLLLLYQNGFHVGKYISFEEQINKYKNSYYESLRVSSTNWHDNSNSYIPFIENFLFSLLTCYRELDNRFSIISDGKFSKTARIESTLLNSLTPMSKKELFEVLPDISFTTIEAVLGKMVRDEKIIKLGSGRNTKYIRKK